MPITRVQHAIAHGTSNAPSVGFGAASASGNLLVLSLTVAATGVTPTFSGWTLGASETGTPGYDTWLYYQANAASATTISGTLSSTSRWIAEVIEYSGLATSSPADQTGSTGNGTGVSPALATTSANEVIVYAYGGDDGTGSWGTPSNSFTIVDQVSNGNPLTLCVADRIVSSTGSYSTTITSTGSPDIAIVGVSFKTSGGGTSVTVTATVFSAAGILSTATESAASTVSTASLIGSDSLPTATASVSSTASATASALAGTGTLSTDAETGVASVSGSPLVGTGSLPMPSYLIGSNTITSAASLIGSGVIGIPQGGGYRLEPAYLASDGLLSNGFSVLTNSGFTVGALVGAGFVPDAGRTINPLAANGTLGPVNLTIPPNLYLNPLPIAASGVITTIVGPGASGGIGFGLTVVGISPLIGSGTIPDIAVITNGNLSVLVGPLIGAGTIPPTHAWTNWTGLGLVYSIYSNTGVGDPINYASPIAETMSLAWTSTPLAYARDWNFGVRVSSLISGLQESNIDATRELMLDANGIDITNRPYAPASLRAFPTVGGGCRAEWVYPYSNPTNKPTGFHVYSGAPGGVNYSSVKATTSYGGARITYSADLTGFADATTYAIGVRAFNATSEELNTVTASFTADSTGPTAIQSGMIVAI